jgi:DNA-directed RNA polymerase subunit omega
MMLYPPIAELLEKVDSRYTLVMEIAKRARQVTAGSENRSSSTSNKSVAVAVQEIYEGKVTYERTEE